MSAQDNGGPAFPHLQEGWTHSGAPGMTLRDYFAAKAMQADLTGHIAHYGHGEHWPIDQLASHAFEVADAMLKARQS